ncbi:unnamed protein product [Rotaria magnacalcarata]
MSLSYLIVVVVHEAKQRKRYDNNLSLFTTRTDQSRNEDVASRLPMVMMFTLLFQSSEIIFQSSAKHKCTSILQIIETINELSGHI